MSVKAGTSVSDALRGAALKRAMMAPDADVWHVPHCHKTSSPALAACARPWRNRARHPVTLTGVGGRRGAPANPSTADA
jgi:hypothetical protein